MLTLEMNAVSAPSAANHINERLKRSLHVGIGAVGGMNLINTLVEIRLPTLFKGTIHYEATNYANLSRTGKQLKAWQPTRHQSALHW